MKLQCEIVDCARSDYNSLGLEKHQPLLSFLGRYPVLVEDAEVDQMLDGVEVKKIERATRPTSSEPAFSMRITMASAGSRCTAGVMQGVTSMEMPTAVLDTATGQPED